MVQGRSDTGRGRRIRLGMVGGGQGAFIGAVHRIASRIDDHYDFVAGALSSQRKRAVASARELGLDPDRSYGNFHEMAEAEAKRDDGIEAVAIVTPNHMHKDPAVTFLKAGFHVICDKPLALSAAEAKEIARAAKKSGKVFALTHNYTGYPMVRQARQMIAAGELGALQVVQAEYAQDWLTQRLETSGQKQAAWRTDPKRSGAGGSGRATRSPHAWTTTRRSRPSRTCPRPATMPCRPRSIASSTSFARRFLARSRRRASWAT